VSSSSSSHPGPIRIVDQGVELTFVSTVTTFGASRDVTLSELSIERLYPADETTRDVLDARCASRTRPVGMGDA
jgi:hypothetical protein